MRKINEMRFITEVSRCFGTSLSGLCYFSSFQLTQCNVNRFVCFFSSSFFSLSLSPGYTVGILLPIFFLLSSSFCTLNGSFFLFFHCLLPFNFVLMMMLPDPKHEKSISAFTLYCFRRNLGKYNSCLISNLH